ncbi:MAG: U32 family peptidase [Elusimicrobiota bacterium]|jgi:putative protease|nr:U32 family peptidase [Elusimicrobiota bacterium]
MKKPELLLPAGSLTALKTAFLYGADAVYVGMPKMNLRAKSSFPLEEIKQGVNFAHSQNKKVYIALNLFSKNADIDKLGQAAIDIKEIAPDGAIVSDPGVFMFLREHLPTLPLRISTQANICSWLTAEFWQKMGADLIVLAREVSFAEGCFIKHKLPDMKIEIFVHGAMCISYSGRCLLSAFLAGRSANLGECAYSCRWKFKSKLLMEEELRQGEFLEMFEDDRGSYILNSKDLCLMTKLDKILSAGFDSLKIEGRNKSPYYIAQTARAYRKAIDDYFKNPAQWQPDIYMAELYSLQNRGYTTGFFDGTPTDEAQDYFDTSSKSDWRNIGTVINQNQEHLEIWLYNQINVGDEIEILLPDVFLPLKIKINEIFDPLTQTKVRTLSPGRPNQAAIIYTALPATFGDKKIPPLSIIRREQKGTKGKERERKGTATTIG